MCVHVYSCVYDFECTHVCVCVLMRSHVTCLLPQGL